MSSEGLQWDVALHDDVMALEAPWRALEERGCCTLFQSFDWLSVWYEVTSRHGAAEPVIVAARRSGSADVEVILPLCRIRRRGFWELTFADLAVTDFIGPVFLPEALRRPGAVRALIAAVAKVLPRGDVIRLDKICPMVRDHPNPLLELDHVAPFPVGIWGIPLSQACSGQRPQGANRRIYNKTQRAKEELAQSCDRTFEWKETPAERSRALDILIDLRMSRFDALGRAEILKDPMWLEFYRLIAERPAPNLRVVVLELKADGETIASDLGIGFGGVLHYLMGGFAPGWDKYRPGFQVMFDLMDDCPARGFHYLDFTIGDERYKKDLGAERESLYETRVPVTLKGRAICLAWRLKVALRDYPRLFALLKRIAGKAEQTDIAGAAVAANSGR